MIKLQKAKTLLTSRLVLEPLREGHSELLFDILKDKKIYKFISEKPPSNILELKRRYKILEKRLSPNKDQIWLNWAIRLKRSKQYIGTIQATIYDNRSTSIAYVITPKFWNNGFAFEACLKMLEFLFQRYEISKATATVDTNNLSSQKLLSKLGFIKIQKNKDQNDYFYELKSENFNNFN